MLTCLNETRSHEEVYIRPKTNSKGVSLSQIGWKRLRQMVLRLSGTTVVHTVREDGMKTLSVWITLHVFIVRHMEFSERKLKS